MEQCPKCLTPMTPQSPFCPRCGYSHAYAPPSSTDYESPLRSRGGEGNRSDVPAREYAARARAALKGRWEISYGTVFLFFMVYSLVGIIPFAGIVAVILLYAPLWLGLHMFFLKVIRSEDAPQLEMIFSGFKQFGVAIGLYFASSLLILLGWALLIIPGIILTTGLWASYYILADHPDMGPITAMRQSWELTRGYRMKSFVLGIRFTGWWLLSILSFGFAVPAVYSYHLTAFAALYEDLR